MTLRYPQPPLSDGVVMLRPWQERDLPVLERAAEDEYVAVIERLPTPFTNAAGREWIARKNARLDADQGWELAVVEVASDQAIGGVGITFRHPPGAAEPGAWVITDNRNSGIAERATRLLCGWALTTDAGIARIQATVEPWNAASQRVLEKLGFVREGLLRSYASWGDARQDVYLYSLLPGDLTSDEAPTAS